MSDSWLSTWLQELNLLDYYTILSDNGLQNKHILAHTNKHQLKEIGITKLGHLNRLCKAVEKLREEFKPEDGLEVHQGELESVVNDDNSLRHTISQPSIHQDSDLQFNSLPTSLSTSNVSKKVPPPVPIRRTLKRRSPSPGATYSVTEEMLMPNSRTPTPESPVRVPPRTHSLRKRNCSPSNDVLANTNSDSTTGINSNTLSLPNSNDIVIMTPEKKSSSPESSLSSSPSKSPKRYYENVGSSFVTKDGSSSPSKRPLSEVPKPPPRVSSNKDTVKGKEEFPNEFPPTLEDNVVDNPLLGIENDLPPPMVPPKNLTLSDYPSSKIPPVSSYDDILKGEIWTSTPTCDTLSSITGDSDKNDTPPVIPRKSSVPDFVPPPPPILPSANSPELLLNKPAVPKRNSSLFSSVSNDYALPEIPPALPPPPFSPPPPDSLPPPTFVPPPPPDSLPPSTFVPPPPPDSLPPPTFVPPPPPDSLPTPTFVPSPPPDSLPTPTFVPSPPPDSLPSPTFVPSPPPDSLTPPTFVPPPPLSVPSPPPDSLPPPSFVPLDSIPLSSVPSLPPEPLLPPSFVPPPPPLFDSENESFPPIPIRQIIKPPPPPPITSEDFPEEDEENNECLRISSIKCDSLDIIELETFTKDLSSESTPSGSCTPSSPLTPVHSLVKIVQQSYSDDNVIATTPLVDNDLSPMPQPISEPDYAAIDDIHATSNNASKIPFGFLPPLQERSEISTLETLREDEPLVNTYESIPSLKPKPAPPRPYSHYLEVCIRYLWKISHLRIFI